MKVAVLGGHEWSKYIASKFQGIEASVVLFSDTKVEESLPFEVRQGTVNQVSKLNLLSSESTEGRSRLCDLFRVIFEMDASSITNRQKEENPDMFKKLSESMINTLNGKIEMAEDFDLIIDCREGSKVSPIGKAGAFCINERVYQGHERFISLVGYTSGNYLISGKGNELAKNLIQLLKIKDKKVFLFYPKFMDRFSFIESLNEDLSRAAMEFFKVADEDLEKKKIIHEKKLKEWEDMEDYVRVKYPKPVLETPMLQEYFNMGIVSIDRLEEHDKFFVTYETYKSFDAGRAQEGVGEIKTLGVDYLVNSYPKAKDLQVYHSLPVNEEGIFFLNDGSRQSLDDQFVKTLNKIKKYFSKN